MSCRSVVTWASRTLGRHLPLTHIPPPQLRPATQQFSASLYLGSQVPSRPQGGQLPGGGAASAPASIAPPVPAPPVPAPPVPASPPVPEPPPVVTPPLPPGA